MRVEIYILFNNYIALIRYYIILDYRSILYNSVSPFILHTLDIIHNQATKLAICTFHTSPTISTLYEVGNSPFGSEGLNFPLTMQLNGNSIP